MAIKLNPEKAYDMLSWNYTRMVLSKFDFHHAWINLVMECVTSTSFYVVANGEAKSYFYLSRRIRQGDSISPYVFTLCVEPLIRQLNLLACNSKTQVDILTSHLCFRISNLVSNLGFADAYLIFSKASSKAAWKIMNTLSKFSFAFGQKQQISYLIFK